MTAEYDLVLFGATGFTGGLVAEYLAGRAPSSPDHRWALAGRSPEKLQAVRERLTAIDPALADLPLLRADATDAASLREIAESARVVASTVGPFLRYGEPLVAACAAAGTDYVDITGEPEFVDEMWLRHNAEAQRTGARLVHACGFDSIPHDLGALFTVGRLPEGEPLTVEAFVRADGTFSGGTFQSAVDVMGRYREGRRVAARRRDAEVRPDGRRVRGVGGPPHRDPVAGGWVVPAPTIDPQIVLRSARALPRYGPDFRYGHFIATRRALPTAGLIGGVATVAALASVPPLRKLLLGVKDAGEGPDAERRARSWFTVTFAGRVAGDPQPRVVCEVSGGDPGYGETAKFLAESALCLAHDAGLPETAGQVTTAVAMGDALTARLQAAGITFAVLDGAAPA
jgi:short subunit dehydrogenase-like uncharacterized protein